jgi:hypothetical protein
MSASATSLIRKRSSAQDLGQARPGTAEKYRNRGGNQQTSADFDGRTASLRAEFPIQAVFGSYRMRHLYASAR